MKNMQERLKEKKVVLTPQRLAIVDFLQRSKIHPTVEDIYNNLKKKYPTMSLATVYTSLEILKQAGEIQELTIRKEKICFDPNPKTHHHFFCRECLEVLDVDISCPLARQGSVEGHKIEEVQAYFYGICSICLKNKRRMKE